MKHQTGTEEAEFDAWQRASRSAAHARRTAARNAAFLLPHLRPGMRLLDAGCGVGSITIGLAERVAPGEVIGVDIDAGTIEAARARAKEHGVTNVRFEQADATALPFGDATFDAAFTHALLQHLPEPLAAVREIARVLKPGGVAGLADADYDGSVIAPSTPALDASIALMIRTHQNAHAGRHLRLLLHGAGFSATAGFAVANADATTEGTARVGEFWGRYHEAEPFIAYVGARGLASREETAAMAAAWREWGASPGAYWATFWCQALGWK